MRHNRFLLVLATCLLSVALGPSQSSAKDCGGDVECECGDTVQGHAVLRANLGVCKETGLFVANGSLLDCDHHTITGRGQEAGVLFDNANGAEVHNCGITNFQIGVRVKGGQGNAIVGNEILDNEKYGIDLADAAAGVRIESNTIRDSGDEGIHVGTGASDNVILGNQFVNSKEENVYLLAASGTRVIGNVMVDARAARGSSSSTARTPTSPTTSCLTIRSRCEGAPGTTFSRTTPSAASDPDTSSKPFWRTIP